MPGRVMQDGGRIQAARSPHAQQNVRDHVLTDGVVQEPVQLFLGILQGAPPRRRSLEDAKEELDWLLDDSVREHMVSDVLLGVWASGGLDSSTVLHYAARH